MARGGCNGGPIVFETLEFKQSSGGTKVWNEERVLSLVDARAPEGLTLEYKKRLPDRSDRDRAEFLKDVSAMANASGGSIVFGISEEAGSAASLSGMEIDNADVEIRRLAQILDSGIEPRLAGVRFSHLRLADGQVLALDVPESFDSPHRYSFNGHSKFVTRNGSHVSELSFDQLRAAFDRSSTRIERLRARWNEEVSLSRLWKPIIPGPVCVVRLSPVISADERQVIDPKFAYEHWNQLIFSDWGGGNAAFNYQGLAVYPGRGEESLFGYVQVHRTGALTAYRTARLTVDERKLIPSTRVGDFVLAATKKLTRFSLLSGIRGSAILNIGLQRLRGYEFGAGDRYGFDDGTVDPGIDEVQMPEVWIEDLEAVPERPDTLLRPGYDLLWQSYGWAECPLFDSDGHWSTDRS